MRIGMITGEYPPLEGGVGAFTRELGAALNALGHEIHILTTAIPPPGCVRVLGKKSGRWLLKPRRHCSFGPQSAAEVGRSWTKTAQGRSRLRTRLARRMPFGLALLLAPNANAPLPAEARDDKLTVYRKVRDWNRSAHAQITEWVHATSLDIVNIQYQAAAYQMRGWINLYPRLQKHACGIPIVVTYHDLLPPYLFPKAGPLRKWTVRQLAQRADGVIVTNDSDYTELTTAAGDTLPTTRLIPIGSNIAPNPPANYDRMAWRTAHNFTPDTLLIGFFGFLNRSKGIETLIDAIHLLSDERPPVHLIFIGGRTGSSDATNVRYADEIDARIERLGIAGRVHRTGFTTPSEVSAALLAADVCALPYRSGANFRRGTLHAALAHGNAIVTTEPQTATPQLRDGENVILIPPENAQALASAIRDLRQHPETRAALGAQAAALSKKFSWERIAAHTAEFFRTLVRK